MPWVVGIDLSLTATGLASPGGVFTIKSKGKATDTLLERGDRLHNLAMSVVAEIILTRVPDLVVIEGPSYGSKGGSQHDRSGAWWLIVNRLRDRGVPVAEVPPSTRAKYASGRGNADKDTCLASVIRRYSGFDVSNNNEADALTLCAMGMDHLGHPLVPVPSLNRETLAKVAWPFVISED